MCSYDGLSKPASTVAFHELSVVKAVIVDKRVGASKVPRMLAHPKILKLARLALDLTQNELATGAGISLRLLQKLEACDQDTTVRTIRLVQQALEDRGVVFLGESESLGSGFRVPMGHLRGATDNSSSGNEKTGRT